MSGLEISEALEVLEATEVPSVSDLQEQREQFRLQADAAREAGNVEKANYFQGEIAQLDAQISPLTVGEDFGETALGEGYASGHSESYWKKAAAKELAEHGKTTWYKSCKDYLEKAIKNDAEKEAKK